MAALQLVGIEELFTPACKHSLQAFKPACKHSLQAFKPACKHSLQAFKPACGMPRKLAGFHPHCALPCTPITAHSTPSN